jgi:hypothetical protein
MLSTKWCWIAKSRHEKNRSADARATRSFHFVYMRYDAALAAYCPVTPVDVPPA